MGRLERDGQNSLLGGSTRVPQKRNRALTMLCNSDPFGMGIPTDPTRCESRRSELEVAS